MIMNDFDYLFENDSNENMTNKSNTFSKEDWAEKKQLERAEAYNLLDSATYEAVNDSEKFRDYLNTLAQFDRYSVSNALLISHQHPGATKLADFKTWKKDDVNINKGEKAITILEPGNEYTRDDGTTGFSVNVKKVFDISQTSNAENRMYRRMPDKRSAIKALISSAPCKVVLVDELGNSSARFSPDKTTIFVVKGLEADELFRSLSYEIGVARFFAKDGTDRSDCAFSAYCASYVLCERYGFDTDDYDFDKVPERFADMEEKDIRKSLVESRDMANDISLDMNRQLEAADKNRNTKDNGAR